MHPTKTKVSLFMLRADIFSSGPDSLTVLRKKRSSEKVRHSHSFKRKKFSVSLRQKLQHLWHQ